MDKNVDLLLQQSWEIINKYDELYQKEGLKYNIFKIAHISEKEVIMCRVIADLLNPKGYHYKGDIYLKLFWDIVSDKMKNPIKIDTANAKVITEFLIYAQRRIDIFIDDGNVRIPIEVKIRAREQKNQVRDYAEYAKNVPVLFLTLYGSPAKTAGKNEYISISFKEDIVSWLEQCLKETETENTPSVREVIKQLLSAIKSIFGETEDKEMIKEIAKLITQSDEAIRSALAINAAIDNLFNDTIEYFKGEILTIVKKTSLGAEYSEDESWISIYVPIKKGKYSLYIHYDWRWIRIALENDKEANPAEEERIAQKLTDRFDVNNDNQDGDVWATKNARLPGLEFADDNIYLYKLRKKYAEDPQEIAKQIIAIVNELENI